SVAAQARAAGVQVYWGACEELSGAFPLYPLLEALGVRDRGADPERAAAVRTLRSGWAPGATADRVAEAVEQLLSLFDEVCGCGPVLLVVDDLQWADDATVLTWSRLAHAVRQLPLLLVGTTRPVPQRDDVSALRRLAGPGGLLRLDGLTRLEIQHLVT